MTQVTAPRLDIDVALTFLAIDPDRGSEHGIGWHWLTEIARRVARVTAVVRPEAAVLLTADRRVPGNVVIATPSEVPPIRSHLPIPSYYLDYASTQAAFGAVLRGLEADISHQVTLATPYWGTSLGEAPGRRVLGPVGISSPAPLWATPLLPGADVKMEWARRALARYPGPPVSSRPALDAADHVLAVDRRTASQAERVGTATSPMMPDGANPVGREAIVPAESRRDLVWAGRMMPRKGCVLAVRAFAAALSRLPSSTHFVVIGDGPERQAVERAIGELELGGRVHLVGSQRHADALTTIGHSRALVFSSLRDTFGGVVLEAAERATPTVWASHQGVDGLRTWFPREAGWSRSVSSGRQFIKTLADGMVAAATAPEVSWSARAEAAYDFALQHNWSIRGDHMVEIYQVLLGGAP